MGLDRVGDIQQRVQGERFGDGAGGGDEEGKGGEREWKGGGGRGEVHGEGDRATPPPRPS